MPYILHTDKGRMASPSQQAQTAYETVMKCNNFPMQALNRDEGGLCAGAAGGQEGVSEIQGSGSEEEEGMWPRVEPSPNKFTMDMSSGFRTLSSRLGGKLREVRIVPLGGENQHQCVSTGCVLPEVFELLMSTIETCWIFIIYRETCVRSLLIDTSLTAS